MQIFLQCRAFLLYPLLSTTQTFWAHCGRASACKEAISAFYIVPSPILPSPWIQTLQLGHNCTSIQQAGGAAGYILYSTLLYKIWGGHRRTMITGQTIYAYLANLLCVVALQISCGWFALAVLFCFGSGLRIWSCGVWAVLCSDFLSCCLPPV